MDPETDKELVVCHDQRGNHPLQHVTMVAVDAIAREQGGGAWCSDGEE